MATEEALEVIRTATDANAGTRSWAVLGIAIKGAQKPPPLFKIDAGKPEPLHLRINIEPWLAYYALTLPSQLLVSTAAGNSFLRHLSTLWHQGQIPCAWPTSAAGFEAKDHYTSLSSSVVALRSLPELLPHFDPRGWAGCGTLFKATCRVAMPAPDDPVCIDPPRGDLGKPWCGLLYEHAGAGPQNVHNLLHVNYRWLPSHCAVGIRYRLWRAISQTLGGWESPGLMRINSGTLVARPCPDDPKLTEVRVSKRVHYGRLSSWSSGTTLDYGELCNYLAPSFLTLWINDLQLVVPCCPARSTAGEPQKEPS